MRYVVITAVGSKTRVLHTVETRREARRLMHRHGGMTVVATRDGRVLESTLSRSIG